MNTIYIDCKNSGISGDLFLSAISGLQGNDDLFEQLVSAINIEFPKVNLKKAEFVTDEKFGQFPRKLLMDFDEKSHHHYHIHDMKQKIERVCKVMGFSQNATEFSKSFLEIIAEAEGSVHKTSPDKVHLHEIGSIDTVVDICGITLYLDKMGLFEKSATGKSNTKIFCSPIALGGGTIKIKHGIVSVPAPATSAIIQKYNIRVFGGPIEKELCTPTGAAFIACLLKYSMLEFLDFMPEMTIDKQSISTGNLKHDSFPNILRILGGSTKDDCINGKCAANGSHDQSVAVLETTVDDVTGEDLGFLLDLLMSKGALDVNLIAAQTKKNRPCTLIKVIANPELIDPLIDIIIKQTGSLGVRYRIEQRRCLHREIREYSIKVDNNNFSYRVKLANGGQEGTSVPSYKIEHDDLVRLALESDKSIKVIRQMLERDFLQKYYEENKK